ncbi:hypothetical protein V2J09_017021 [Rumex salicifolius]
MWSPKSVCVANPSFPIPTNLHPPPSSDAGHGFPPPPSSSLPHLSFPKPSLVVHTESNVRKWVRKKPNPPCVVCDGSGKVCCRHCHGKVETVSGQYPKLKQCQFRCKTCGGSGLCYCDRCLGTGEYRDVIGFHFLKQSDSTRDSGHRTIRVQEDEHLGAADFLLSGPINPPDESS